MVLVQYSEKTASKTAAQTNNKTLSSDSNISNNIRRKSRQGNDIQEGKELQLASESNFRLS